MARLERTLGLFQCTVMGVGVILGAGIYALVGKAAALGGNAVWISFVAAAVVAAFTGLSYAELSSFIPRAGGEYHYARRAFGPFVAFLMSWMLLAGLVIAAAAVALGFGGYLHRLAGVEAPVGAALVVAGCAGLLIRGTRESVTVAAFATGLEVLGLVAVMVVGLPYMGSVDLLEPSGEGWAGVGMAAALIFFAYIGFEEIVQLAEETRNPTRNMPLALVLSIGITTVLYVLVAVAAISAVGAERLGESTSPLAEVFANTGWQAPVAISFVALFSTGNTVLILIMSGARLLYGMAEAGALPSGLADVGDDRHTPWASTLLISGCAAGAAMFFGRIETVASLTNLALFTTFLVINGAVIGLRFTEPRTERPFRIPGALFRVPLIPVLGIVSVLAMMGQVDLESVPWAAGFLALGVAAWWVRPRNAAGDAGTV